MKVTYQPPSEYEKLKEAISEYESIFGTNTYTGNKDRDETYKNLRERLRVLEKKEIRPFI